MPATVSERQADVINRFQGSGDPFPDLPELLTTRQQIARVLGYASWDDRYIKPLILANGCPVTRLPGEGRKGAWRARKSAILAWLEARAA